MSAIKAVKGGWDKLAVGCNYVRCVQEHFARLCELGVSQTPGPSIYLTSDEEELKPLLMEVSKLGYGKTQKVKLIFEAVAKEKWVLQCEKLSNAWLHQFLERRPNHSFPPHSVTTSLCSGLPSSLVTPSPCSGHSPFLAVVFLPPPQ